MQPWHTGGGPPRAAAMAAPITLTPLPPALHCLANLPMAAQPQRAPMPRPQMSNLPMAHRPRPPRPPASEALGAGWSREWGAASALPRRASTRGLRL